MKYQRLKSIDGSGTIMRYYELAEGQVAYTNCFYDITSNKCSKVSGTPTGELIGFSHGGDRLVSGCMLLDINPAVVYMGILEDGDDDRPNIGEIVNGYQKVIDTHYDGDEGVSGKGTKPEEWGIERMTNPYYLFTIVQPEGTEATIDDSTAGTPTHSAYPVVEPMPLQAIITFESNGGSTVPAQLVVVGEKATEPTDPTKDGYTFGGWYTEAALTNEFDFDTAIEESMTLYAKWTP